MKNLMLAGLDGALLSQLHDHLHTQYNIHTCGYGPDVVAEFLALLPELLVIDLTMGGCDTVGLLRAVQARDGQTQVLAVSCSYHDHIRELLSMVDTAFLLIHPFDAGTIATRLTQLEQLLVTSGAVCIDEILWDMGLDSHCVGFPCLCTAIIYKYEHPKCLYTDDLCVHVAKCRGCTALSVDKAMIHCIRKAWRRRDPVLWTHYLGYSPADITSAQFITAIARYMKSVE